LTTTKSLKLNSPRGNYSPSDIINGGDDNDRFG